MRVLVTGAFGYIGMAVARRLAADGHTVVALTSRPAAADAVPEFIAAVHRVDLRDADAGDRQLRDAVTGVDAVCHLAGRTGVRDSAGRGGEYAAVNAGGTTTLLAALLAARAHHPRSGGQARFVLASSAAVYGAPARQPITEATPLEPASPYGASKAAAEHAVTAAVRAADGALGAVSLRIFNAAGADGGRADMSTTRVIPNILAVAAGRAPSLAVNGDGSVIRDYVHVSDVADAFARALRGCAAGAHAAYNVGATPASVTGILAAAREVTGRPIPVTWRPARDEPPVLVADCALGHRELEWAPARSALRHIIADAWAAAGPDGGRAVPPATGGR